MGSKDKAGSSSSSRSSEEIEENGSRTETLAEATQRVLRDRFKSLRDAEAGTGVNYNTIKSMKDGREVGAEFVLKFAIGAGEDPIEWLRLIGIDLRPYVRKYAEQAETGQRMRIRPGDEIEVVTSAKPNGSAYTLDEKDASSIIAILDVLRQR